MEAIFFKLKLLAPGLIGALLAAFTGPIRDMKTRFTGFCFGFCIALFGSSPLLHFFKLDADTYSAGIGFALGYFGMGVTEALMKAVRETDIAGIIKSKFGGSQ